jgi:glucose-1-phosphate thymidylyltransferase
VLIKAVIVVGAGTGSFTRRRGETDLGALELVANRPIVQHALDRLTEAAGGVIVAGDANALLDVRSSLEGYASSLDRVDYVVCSANAGLASTLRSVESRVGGMACLIQPADGLLDEPLSSLVELLNEASSDLLMLSTGGDREAGPDGSNGDALDVLSRSSPPRVLDVGLLAPGALGHAAESLSSEPAAYLGMAADLFDQHGLDVRVEAVDGWHRYRGHRADLLELNRVALDRLTRAVPPAMRYGSQIDGAVSIDPSARVSSSVVLGPVIIGPRAVVSHAYVGPYTSIGADARVEGSEVERSIVSPGASLIHVGSRLVSSVVGRDARVYRHFALPRALRLWVGDGDEVALC